MMEGEGLEASTQIRVRRRYGGTAQGTTGQGIARTGSDRIGQGRAARHGGHHGPETVEESAGLSSRGRHSPPWVTNLDESSSLVPATANLPVSQKSRRQMIEAERRSYPGKFLVTSSAARSRASANSRINSSLYASASPLSPVRGLYSAWSTGRQTRGRKGWTEADRRQTGRREAGRQAGVRQAGRQA